MARTKSAGELKPSTTLRGGRARASSGEKFAAGWLAYPNKPDEDLIRLGGFAWSELFVGAQTRRIYKSIKNTGEWFRFAFVQTEDAKAAMD